MLRSALIAAAAAFACLAVAVAPAAAQVGADGRSLRAPVFGEPGVSASDFVLEPATESDLFWIEQLRAGGRPPVGHLIAGPALAEPGGDKAVGPVMAGPFPAARPPLIRRRRLEPDGDPFAPIGMKVGRFDVRAAIELGFSATDNVAGGRDEESAVGLVVAPQLAIRTENERYALAAELGSEAILYGDEEFDERETDARLLGRYDLTERTSLSAEAAYSSNLDSYTDPDTPDAAVERPAVEDLAASLGVTQRFGALAVLVAGSVEREVHEEVALAGGGAASREELDNTEYGARVRTSFEVSGALTPFTEFGAGRREYDIEVDSDGFARSSLWSEAWGGVVFDLGSRLNGEVALGYRHEDLDDDELENIDAVLGDVSIFWTPRERTALRVFLASETHPTGIPGTSGSVIYEGGLIAAQRFFGRWQAESGIGIEYEDFIGVDREDLTNSLYASLSYALSRRAVLIARYGYERTDSTDPEDDEDENVISLRVRLQQ